MRNIAFAAFALGLSLGVSAKPIGGFLQRNYSAQLEVQETQQLSSSVEQLCKKSQAQITNFNFDSAGGSGNLNVIVPDDQLDRFSEGLRHLGKVTRENRSMSDNTTSYLDCQRNLANAEKSLAAHWSCQGSELTALERGLAEAEFKTYLRDRIQSYRSQLVNYEQNRGVSQVSVSFSGQGQGAP